MSKLIKLSTIIRKSDRHWTFSTKANKDYDVNKRRQLLNFESPPSRRHSIRHANQIRHLLNLQAFPSRAFNADSNTSLASSFLVYSHSAHEQRTQGRAKMAQTFLDKNPRNNKIPCCLRKSSASSNSHCSRLYGLWLWLLKARTVKPRYFWHHKIGRQIWTTVWPIRANLYTSRIFIERLNRNCFKPNYYWFWHGKEDNFRHWPPQFALLSHSLNNKQRVSQETNPKKFTQWRMAILKANTAGLNL
jgi:hypothetical protein